MHRQFSSHHRRAFASLLIALICLAGGFPASALAQAATITVNTTADELNRDGDCSLREALTAANEDRAVDRCAVGQAADIIFVPRGTYKLTLAGVDEDAAATGDLDITEPLTLSGAGQAATIIDGNALDRVIENFAENVALSGLTIRNGEVDGEVVYEQGGGISNHGVLSIVRSAITNNQNSSYSFSVPGLVLKAGGVFNTGTLTVVRSIISDNFAPVGASEPNIGGIYNRGSVTLTDSSVDNNQGNVGGILNEGSLSVTGGSISDNSGWQYGGINNTETATMALTKTIVDGNDNGDDIAPRGGGIYNEGVAAISYSTISNNFNRGGAGGIGSQNVLTLDNSTISGNGAFDSTGGIGAGGSVTIRNSTIVDNTASSRGSCCFVAGAGISGSASLLNTIIAGNISDVESIQPSDCAGTFSSRGWNMIGNTQNCNLSGETRGNQLNVDPKLGPLQDNGGPTPTHALLAGSPAIDTGVLDRNQLGNRGCASFDQRYVARPQNYTNLPFDPRCDIGAYELAVPVTAYALSENNELLRFASDQPGSVQARVAVTGLQGGEKLLGMDWRELDGRLYAVGSSNRLYRINPETGLARAVQAQPFSPALNGTLFGVDIDPRSEQLHVISDSGQHLRFDIESGAMLTQEPVLRYVAGDANYGKSPLVDGAAFTSIGNPFATSASPSLYVLDSRNDVLAKVQGNKLYSVGALGTKIESQLGFDIAPSGLAYAAVRADDGISGAVLAEINLSTGRLRVLGRIGAGENLRGLAIGTAP